MNLIFRLIKGTPITAEEHDSNLNELQTKITELENLIIALDARVTTLESA